MSNNQNNDTETYYFAFLNRVLVLPNLVNESSGELQTVLNKLMLLNNMDQLTDIRNRTFSLLNLSPPPFTSSFIAVQEIKRVIIAIARNSQALRMKKVGEIRNDTNVNRVKTSDKQTKAMIDFVKG